MLVSNIHGSTINNNSFSLWAGPSSSDLFASRSRVCSLVKDRCTPKLAACNYRRRVNSARLDGRGRAFSLLRRLDLSWFQLRKFPNHCFKKTRHKISLQIFPCSIAYMSRGRVPSCLVIGLRAAIRHTNRSGVYLPMEKTIRMNLICPNGLGWWTTK
jgi:hypothetical protein